MDPHLVGAEDAPAPGGELVEHGLLLGGEFFGRDFKQAAHGRWLPPSCPRIAVRRTASLRSPMAGIHIFIRTSATIKAWMAGTSPAMTQLPTEMRLPLLKSRGLAHGFPA